MSSSQFNANSKIILRSGSLSLEVYEKVARTHNLDPQKTIFIFPSNFGHHTKHHNLYSIKTGGGLATLAEKLGRAGIPTLGLPTMVNQLSSASQIPSEVKKAVGDLWAAAGYGMSFILPIRPFGKHFFSKPLKETQFEPSFWGQNAPQPNKILADYYTEQLNLLMQFICTNEPKQKEDIRKEIDAEFNNRFLEGEKMDPNHPWVKPLILEHENKVNTKRFLEVIYLFLKDLPTYQPTKPGMYTSNEKQEASQELTILIEALKEAMEHPLSTSYKKISECLIEYKDQLSKEGKTYQYLDLFLKSHDIPMNEISESNLQAAENKINFPRKTV